MDDLARMKEQSKTVWALGDYPAVAQRFEAVADEIVAAAGVRAGDRVLDLAAGNGNVAIAAARAGAVVTASDFTPEMVAAGRERTDALGLDVDWGEADLEALPHSDGAFDAVISTFGLMFATDAERAAAEAFRVVRPGGVVATTAWTPDGFTGQVTALMGEYLPAPLGAAQPIDWGIEAVVRQRVAPYADEVAFERGFVTWEFGSLDEATAWQESNFGALVAARRRLDEQYAELRERLVALMDDWNRAGDGTVRLPAAYLRAVARRREG